MYIFKDELFGLREDGIDLLRSGFPYRKIHRDSIDSIRIYKGRKYQRWLLMLVLGITLLGLSVWFSYQLYIHTMDPETHRVYIESYAAIALPALLGGFLLFASLQKSPNMQLNYDGKRVVCSLKVIEKKGKLSEFIDTIQKLVPGRNVQIELDPL